MSRFNKMQLLNASPQGSLVSFPFVTAITETEIICAIAVGYLSILGLMSVIIATKSVAVLTHIYTLEDSIHPHRSELMCFQTHKLTRQYADVDNSKLRKLGNAHIA
jgi:hypothetical protein